MNQKSWQPGEVTNGKAKREAEPLSFPESYFFFFLFLDIAHSPRPPHTGYLTAWREAGGGQRGHTSRASPPVLSIFPFSEVPPFHRPPNFEFSLPPSLDSPLHSPDPPWFPTHTPTFSHTLIPGCSDFVSSSDLPLPVPA